MRRALLAALFVAAAAGPLRAQTPASLIDRAKDAYNILDLNLAAGLIRRAFRAVELGASLSDDARAEGLIYLAAAETLRGNADSATSAFRQLVLLAPRYRPDDLVFPPEVTTAFDGVRRGTKAVAVEIPQLAVLRVGQDLFTVRLYASSFHQLVTRIVGADGRPVRTLYDGTIGDSLDVVWNGQNTAGSPLETGSYTLVMESRAPSGELLRLLRIPLDVELDRQDTLALPADVPDSLFLAERLSSSPGIESLVGGLVAGLAALALPSLVAPDADLSSARFGVAGAVTVGGLIGFFVNRGRPIPDNIEANRELRESYRAELDRVRNENRRRRTNVTIRVITGRPSAVEPG